MFIQRGLAPIHLVLDDPRLSADEKLILLPRLLAAGAEANQTVTDGSLVCVWFGRQSHGLLSLLLFFEDQYIFIKLHHSIFSERDCKSLFLIDSTI